MSASSLHILLVDDAGLLRLTIAQALRAHGMTVTERSSAEQAADILSIDSTIDVVVTDYILPDRNGLWLVALAASRNIPAIVVSGLPAPHAATQASLWLLKPVPISELAMHIAELAKDAESSELSQRLHGSFGCPADLCIQDAERSSSVVIGLDSSEAIQYFNPSYERFARQNGAAEDFVSHWGLGRSIFDCIPEFLHEFYRAGFAKARKSGLWTHHYECSSPELVRYLEMRVMDLEERGVLCFHSVLHDESRELDPSELNPLTTTITQCANCRRIQNEGSEKGWRHIASAIKSPPSNVSHGLCNICLPLYSDS